MEPLIIKVAVNEWVPKELNPHAPYGPDEIAADIAQCVDAGASVFHFHARDPRTGEQRRTDVDLLEETFRAVHETCDCIISPGYQPSPIETRFAHLEALVARGVPVEMCTFDIGSFNLTTYDDLRTGSRPQLESFDNSHADMKFYFELADLLGLYYTMGLREPGNLRAVLAYHDLGWLREPLLPKFYLSAKHPYGLPPTVTSLRTYVDLLPADVPARWFTEIKGEDVHFSLSAAAVELGGHVRTGLGDNPVIHGRPLSNAEMVATVADAAVACGRAIATVAEARTMLSGTASAPGQSA